MFFTLGAAGRSDSVSVEHIVSVLRYHSAGAYGSPAAFSATVLRSGDVALIVDARGRYTAEIRRAVRDALAALGIDTAIFNRARKGRMMKCSRRV